MDYFTYEGVPGRYFACAAHKANDSVSSCSQHGIEILSTLNKLNGVTNMDGRIHDAVSRDNTLPLTLRPIPRNKEGSIQIIQRI